MRRLKCEKETIILTNEDDGLSFFSAMGSLPLAVQQKTACAAREFPAALRAGTI